MTELPLPRAVTSATLHHLEQLIDGASFGSILFDPSGAILWSNAAAREMHGVATTADLGATADDYCRKFVLRYRNSHRLHAREYPIMRMLAGEAFDDVVVDVIVSGENEPRWTHKVRDVVMSDADGEPDCLALVIEDASARFEAEERFESMFNANPAPALIMRIADQRYVRVNQGFLDMTGYTREAVIGRSLYEVDVLANAERLDIAKDRLAAGRTVPQMEADIALPGGGDKLVIVAGQPIEVADERCMLFTFADLEPRRKAERALRGSETRFSSLFQLAPIAIAVTSADGQRIVEVNEGFTHMTGYTAAQSIGRAPDDLGLWDDAGHREQVEAEIRERGGVRGCDVRVLRRDGTALDCLVSAENIMLRDQRCTLWLYQDITSRRHTELELIEAIDGVMKETSWFSRTVMEKLANLRSPRAAAGTGQVSELTPREREVLELICEGLDDRKISERLSVSTNTVRNHVARIYAKTGVNRRGAVVVWARQRGLYSTR